MIHPAFCCFAQETNILPGSFRQPLIDIFEDWQNRTARCLKEAQASVSIAASLNCDRLAVYFWTGWEGAVLRAKLAQSAEPLAFFAEGFFHLVEAR